MSPYQPGLDSPFQLTRLNAQRAGSLLMREDEGGHAANLIR